jgi:hypothetical protein
MTGESEEPRGPVVIPSLRTRIARYREQAAHFARLAEAERDARFREYWENLAREYASFASELERRMERNRSGRKGRG